MTIVKAFLGLFFVGGITMTINPAANTKAAEPPAKKLDFAIAIHGGAGIEPDKIPAAEKERCEAGLARALDLARKLAAEGKPALDVVEQAIRVLEDDPEFNAGRGAVFNSAGGHELDASIMDGGTGQGGAVAGVTTVKNPISLARLVMTKTPHVLLQSAGAESFADEMRDSPLIERVPNSYFTTPERRKQWEKRKAAAIDNGSKGTVGCVVLDKSGNLAAGTSTGGVINKRWGRVGDSPILGAGTYANNATCAVSCTGTGEFFIRNSVAFHVSALMLYKGMSLDEATRYVIEEVLPTDIGGLIAVDHMGRISMRFNTPGMARAAADSTGLCEIKLGK